MFKRIDVVCRQYKLETLVIKKSSYRREADIIIEKWAESLRLRCHVNCEQFEKNGASIDLFKEEKKKSEESILDRQRGAQIDSYNDFDVVTKVSRDFFVRQSLLLNITIEVPNLCK